MAKNDILIQKIQISFELKCLKLINSSYELAIAEKKVSCDWEEESISAHLVKHLKNLNHDYSINFEVYLGEEDVFNAVKKVKQAKRIDILFQKRWQRENDLEYHIEAKNISSVQWQKSTGQTVNASQQQTDYISEGMDRFITGHFKDKMGCMLGYVVNRTLNEVTEKINIKLESKGRLTEKIVSTSLTIGKHSVYKSAHSNRQLKHLFYIFSN